eukprot:Awhi_evm1s4149
MTFWDSNSSDVLPCLKVFVVLGQSLWPDGKPPSVLLDRVDHAASLYKQALEHVTTTNHQQPFFYVSGADVKKVNKSEGQVMRDLLILRHNIDSSNIIMDSQAKNTIENAMQLDPILNVEIMKAETNQTPIEVIIVTSEFHMPRSSFVFKMVFREKISNKLIKITCSPAPAVNDCDRHCYPGKLDINAYSIKQRLELERRLMLNTMIKWIQSYGHQCEGQDSEVFQNVLLDIEAMYNSFEIHNESKTCVTEQKRSVIPCLFR